MILIEHERFLNPAIYVADNISDLLVSRNEVLSQLDQEFKDNFQRLPKNNQNDQYPRILPNDFPAYLRKISVFVPFVNHDPDDNLEGIGIKLSDNSSFLYAKLPTKLRQFFSKLRDSDASYDYNYWKDTYWVQRKVILSATYQHDPSSGFYLLHASNYTLESVNGWSKLSEIPDRSPNYHPYQLDNFIFD